MKLNRQNNDMGFQTFNYNRRGYVETVDTVSRGKSQQTQSINEPVTNLILKDELQDT